MINNKTKVFLFTIFLISLFVTICSKDSAIGGIFLTGEREINDNKKLVFSDLYRFCKIDYFKEEYIASEDFTNNPHPDSCEIFLSGDSFFYGMINGENTAQLIEKITGLSVYNMSLYKNIAVPFPLAYLKNINITPDKRRILVLESVERFSLANALNNYLVENTNLEIRYKINSFKKEISSEKTEYWILNSIFAHKIRNIKSNFSFNLFGKISSEISAFSLTPCYLFYKEETDFHLQKKNENEISAAAGNINKLADILDKKYNMDLIYVIIPNKYTLYGNNANSNFEYDNYIPNLISRLTKKTNVINGHAIYNEFLKNNNCDSLYFRSDTHFTPFGREILLNRLMEKINEIRESQNNSQNFY